MSSQSLLRVEGFAWSTIPRARQCHGFVHLVQWSVHWAPSQTTRVLVLAGARRCALETCGTKKMQAPLLGFAKSIYYMLGQE